MQDEPMTDVQQELDRTITHTITSLQNIEQYLKDRFQKLTTEKNDLERRQKEIATQEADLKSNRENWEREKKRVGDANAKAKDLVKLNVGGRDFDTTRSTLCTFEGTMLSAMFSGRHTLQVDEQGRYFIDRDPKLFRYVLSFLRDQRFDLPKDQTLAEDILKELDYFCLPVNEKKVKMNFIRGTYRHTRDFKGHTNPVGCLGLLCGGRKLVSGSNDNTLKIWDMDTGLCEKTLTGHTGSVYALKVHHHHSDLVVTGSHDKRIKVWDINSASCVATLVGHTDRVWCLQISSDGRSIISGGADNHIKVWDFTTRTCTQTLKGHRSWVRCVEIHRGKIYSGSDDNEIRIWKISSGECLRTLRGHDESVFALTLLGDLLISGGKDQTIRIWDRKNGELRNVLFGHTRPVYCLQAVDGLLISGSWDTTIRIWDLVTNKQLQKLTGHSKAVYTVIMAGEALISGSSDNTIRVWETTEEGEGDQEDC